MSVDNHLSLPEEVFEIILHHLDLRDVLSCSLVCLGWRNAVNSDHIWRMLCKKNIPEERLKLQAERKRVKSSYEVFESENLTKLCFWRKRYMDDIDLKRNWKTGCFQEDIITDLDDGISYHENRMEISNELLLVPYSLRYSQTPYTVYNIVDDPIMSGKIHLAMSNHVTELFKLCNNILVIVQGMLMQVYATDEDRNLNFQFHALFDRDHPETIFFHTQDLSNWYEIVYPSDAEIKCYPSDAEIKCEHNGKYFAGMYSNYLDDVGQLYSPLHIWDLEFHTKVQEVAFPRQVPGEQLLFANFFLRDNIVHRILTYHSSTLIYSYDIEKSSHNKTVLQLEGILKSMLFTRTMAVMESPQEAKLLLFDLSDGRLLDNLEKRSRTEFNRVQAFRNLITYADSGYLDEPSTVTVYDSEKLCLKDKFEVEGRFVSCIHNVMDDLIIISTYDQLFIRDMMKREILRTVECFGFLPPEPSCSKMLVQKPGYELALLHFW